MHVNETSLEWTEVERGGVHFRRKQLGDAAGGEQLGTSLYELPPGGASWPYHYHTGNEEAIYVLAGTGTLRLAGEERDLEPGDYAALPADESGTHRVRNDGDEPLHFLVVSTMNEPDVLGYPDRDKVGVVAGSAPGEREQRTLNEFSRREGQVDYWTGDDEVGTDEA